jgi:hypothetical protein
VTDAATHVEAFEPPARRHSWGKVDDYFTRLDNTPSGCAETERVCKRCGMTRITIHPPQGYPWHVWKPKGGERVQLDSTPPCLPDEARG